MSSNILEVSDLTVQFGGVIACDDVSFDVRRGELFALIGPNGAGKTSIVNAITGVYQPNEGGSIKYIDRGGTQHQIVGQLPHKIVRFGVARTFQNLGLFPSLTVLDNLLLGRYSHQRSNVLSAGFYTRSVVREEVAAREAVERLIDLLEIHQYRWSPVGHLPYGVQKRIEFGRVLAMEPDLLLLDEPAAGMTLEEKRDIVRFIFAARRQYGITVLLIEHDMAVVMSIADRVLALNYGETLALGVPADIRTNQAVIDAYFGVD